MGRFEVGDRVEWTSQAGGRTTKKVGTVKCIVTKADLHRTSRYRWAMDRFGDTHAIMFDGLSVAGGGEFCYLVEVREGNRKPKLYSPFPSKLRLEVMMSG